MAIGALIPLTIFILVAGSVGFRLIQLWRRTRQAPEMILGCGLAVLAAGMPLAAAGRAPAIALETPGLLIFCAGLIVSVTGVCMLMFFTYYVFRLGTGWAQALVAAMVLAEALAVAWICAMNFQGGTLGEIKDLMRPGTVALMAIAGAAFAWGSVEAFRYRSALRKQLALGLGDPVLANRFGLWATAGATSTTLVVAILWCVMQGMTILREPLPLSALAASGTIMSATWYLTFFAPDSYLRFIRQRAAQNS